jgi:hypothetical protein
LKAKLEERMLNDQLKKDKKKGKKKEYLKKKKAKLQDINKLTDFDISLVQ